MSGTTYIAPPYVWGIAAAILIYLAMVGYLMNYLKNAHRSTWNQLGSPRFVPPIGYVLPSIKFIFWSDYKGLRDSRLAILIWLVRILFALCLGLIVAGELLHFLPTR